MNRGYLTAFKMPVVKPINAKNIRDVHQRLEKGRTIGKIALAEWS